MLMRIASIGHRMLCVVEAFRAGETLDGLLCMMGLLAIPPFLFLS